MSQVEMKSIGELLGMNFFIPSYQRGYRWDSQQVKELLEDIWSFTLKIREDSEIYCIQPLVMKRHETNTKIFDRIKNEARNLLEIESILKGSWEVIDGQQRLTTIYILLLYLEVENKYTIRYETRPGSANYLENLSKDEEGARNNIDYYHMYNAWQTITHWMSEHLNEKEKQYKFKEILLDKVKFISYTADDEENSIKIFTRLNIGKIALTDSELIKALFLNRTNFKEKSHLHLQQQEIANEWDTIEYTLQNDEFWLFMHKTKYSTPTRIDYIFDLMREDDALGLKELLASSNKSWKDIIGTDEHVTFRYFYEYFKIKEKKGNLLDTWSKVKGYFQIIREWFDDLELYHYVGYLIAMNKTSISELIREWKQGTKLDFIKKIQDKIRKSLSGCNNLEQEYETNGNPKKTDCKPLLLLHNIQTVINQNKQLKNHDMYSLPVFYKFPFHLFKRENWDVEHIDSSTSNNLDDPHSKKEWLKDMGIEISDNTLFNEIQDFIKGSDMTAFDKLKEKVERSVETVKNAWLDDADKNRIWNFCLLDSSTNRSYGNAIFSSKRRTIIGKDQGKLLYITDNLSVEEKEGAIAFVPPVTKNIFLKYYNPSTNMLRAWTKEDADAYKRNIESTLKDFGIKK